jgi:hypothetical protein
MSLSRPIQLKDHLSPRSETPTFSLVTNFKKGYLMVRLSVHSNVAKGPFNPIIPVFLDCILNVMDPQPYSFGLHFKIGNGHNRVLF